MKDTTIASKLIQCISELITSYREDSETFNSGTRNFKNEFGQLIHAYAIGSDKLNALNLCLSLARQFEGDPARAYFLRWGNSMGNYGRRIVHAEDKYSFSHLLDMGLNANPNESISGYQVMSHNVFAQSLEESLQIIANQNPHQFLSVFQESITRVEGLLEAREVTAPVVCSYIGAMEVGFAKAVIRVCNPELKLIDPIERFKVQTLNEEPHIAQLHDIITSRRTQKGYEAAKSTLETLYLDLYLTHPQPPKDYLEYVYKDGKKSPMVRITTKKVLDLIYG